MRNSGVGVPCGAGLAAVAGRRRSDVAGVSDDMAAPPAAVAGRVLIGESIGDISAIIGECLAVEGRRIVEKRPTFVEALEESDDAAMEGARRKSGRCRPPKAFEGEG